jgi:hypothetical protein
MTSSAISEHGLEATCLHVAPSDDPFTARMRFHQSWYRRHVLNLPPGSNPSARGTAYGNMLRPEDGLQGYNFLSAGIHRCAEQRVSQARGMVEPNRLRNNLLSSQPMCFNLFAPLAQDPSLASRLAAALLQLPEPLQVTEVRIEYAPAKEQHLNDNTAFDAWIAYERGPDIRGFVGIETKLTEPFSQAHFGFENRYRRWRDQAGWWWRPGSEEEFSDKRFNQLWRNHLLAFSALHQPEPTYQEGFCAIIYHDGDTACTQAIDAYRAHLEPLGQTTLQTWCLSEVVGCWAGLVQRRARREWLNAFRLRYLGLQASQPAWRIFEDQNQG